MLDIVKEYIRLNRSLALLPIRAARKLLDDRNTSARQVADVAEDLVSTPFVAADKAIENSCRQCEMKQEHEEYSSAAGPGVKNILVDPKVTVLSDTEINSGERRALLSVTGLLCGG